MKSTRKERPKKRSPEPKSEPEPESESENISEEAESQPELEPRKTRGKKRTADNKDAFGSLGSIGAFLTRSFVRAISGTSSKMGSSRTEDNAVSEDDDASELEPKLKRVKSLDESNLLTEPTSPSHLLLDRLKSPSGSVKSDSFVRSIGESTRSSKKSSVKSDGSPKKSEKSSKRSERSSKKSEKSSKKSDHSSKKSDLSKPDSEPVIEPKSDEPSQTYTGTFTRYNLIIRYQDPFSDFIY